VPNLCNSATALAFVHNFEKDASTVAATLAVPVENILGLAAEESQYGQGRIARVHNNYFSMHAPAPLMAGTAPALGDPKMLVAVYTSFLQSAQSFAARFGSAVRGQAKPDDFAHALQRAKFNTGNSATGGRDHFVLYLIGVIDSVRVRMQCP
jgi:flagellum-specific peptidoglycan hydrolase FlgJ